VFSNQAAIFDRLIDEGMTPTQVGILKSIFCNAESTLEHKGVVGFQSTVTGVDFQAAKWARCVQNWDYDTNPPSKGGGVAYVYAQKCDNPNGINAGGERKKIYLPVTSGQDPNVVSGDIIMFFTADDGSALAPGYGDNRIGSIIMNTQGDYGIKGYGLCNGTANASGSSRGSGSGANLAGSFPRCWSSPSDNKTTGGSAASNLTIEGTFTANDIGNHSHTLNETTIGTGSESTVDVITSTPTGDSGVDLGTISVTFTGASGSGSPTAATIPPYTYVAFLERLDNSRSGLGA